MRDIQLWWRLHDAPGPDLAEELEALALLGMPERSPFLGLVAPLLSHLDPVLRRSAVAVLAGTRGMAGLRALVGALDDPEPSVRDAAVEALRATAGHEPTRWAHAIFHPRADVRAAALRGKVHDNCAHLGAYLRADPDNQAAARSVPFPQPGLGLLFGLWERGAIDATAAAARLAEVPQAPLRQWLGTARRRAPEAIRRITRTAVASECVAPITGRDALDAWVEIVAAADSTVAVAATHALAEAIFAPGLKDFRPRLTVAVLHQGGPQLQVPAPLLALAVACDPRMLAMGGYPLAARRQAATGMAAYRRRIQRTAPGFAERLLRSDLATRSDGSPIIEVAAAIAGLLRARRIATLVEVFGLAAIAAKLPGNLGAWAILCDLPEEAGQWSTRLLDAAARHDPRAHCALVSIALLRFAAVDHTALKRTIAAATPAGPLLADLVGLVQAGIVPGSDDLVAELAARIAPQVRVGDLPALFAALTDRMADTPAEPAVCVLAAVAACCDPTEFSLAVADMPEATAAAMLGGLGQPLALPDPHQRALARDLADAKHPGVVQWVAEFVRDARPSPTTRRHQNTAHVLNSDEAQTIALATREDLSGALGPALARSCSGLAAALARRTWGSECSRDVCVTLIGCADPPDLTWPLLDQAYAEGEMFASGLDAQVAHHWLELCAPSWLCLAWLHRYERHAFAMLDRIDNHDGGLLGVLAMVEHLPGVAARRKMWEAIASSMALRRSRQRARLVPTLTHQLNELCLHIVAQLDTDVGVYAAKLLVTLHLAGLNMSPARHPVLVHACDMDRETTHALASFIHLDGLPPRTRCARPRERALTRDVRAKIRACLDLDALQAQCRHDHLATANAAAHRLAELGSLGERRLVALLGQQVPARCFAAIAETVPRWADPQAIERVRTLARAHCTPAQIRYRLACTLHGCGEPGWVLTMLQALRVPTRESWFRPGEWESLVRAYPASVTQLSLELTDSPHPHAYRKAVQHLLGEPPDEANLSALRRFLEQGSVRPSHLRRAVAKLLNDCGDPLGLPVLMSAVTQPDKDWEQWVFTPPTPALSQALGELLTASCLYGGPRACGEMRVLDLAERLAVPGHAVDEIATRLLADARHAATCKRIVLARGAQSQRAYKVREIAEVFAWGVRRGRELTGRLFAIHMTWRRGDYGHTYLNSNAVHVTPLPLLRRDREGRDVVEALILHEFGHHMYHRGAEPQGVWQRATSEGLGHLLNLVADEHLERNLRALHSEYGDRLKRLASFAFQHNERELPLDSLLVTLGASAFDALCIRPLGVAFDARSIRIQSGDLLRELERTGNSFARFVRALRQGLGNRQDDPIVAEALDLFRVGFRHSDRIRLYAITKRLQELFGLEAQLAEQIGGHETIKGTPREAAEHGADLDDDAVQREVERILDPRQLDRLRGGREPGGKPTRLAVNVIDDDSFQKIGNIVPVAPDPDKHRAVALEVRRHAARLRRHFEEMGLNYVPQRARVRGRAFDRTRARAVVLRRDPRMLVARELVVTSDLFIGVVVDCSGSMGVGESMAKAHRFGVLLAEAARGLRNVQARFFGFTDRVIYDAGDERACAVANLEPGGGNNDAAALYHAATVAGRSRRRSKLLVMVSDGLPTECSAVALRALALRITRRQGIMCAQVAVRPLTEVCFPHYVEIQPGDELDVAVRRFGEIVSKLARRALGR